MKKTSRKPKTNRVPRTRACGEWTEASFWSFIRSNIRRMSMRWPPLSRIKLMNRRHYVGPIGRQKWEYQCAECKNWFPDKHVHVDHIVPCGKLLSFEDIGPFVERLLVEADALQVLCEDCHANKTRK